MRVRNEWPQAPKSIKIQQKQVELICIVQKKMLYLFGEKSNLLLHVWGAT